MMSSRPSEPVRAAYVVLSHRDWNQVRRLTDAILRSTPNARVLIAHDARAEDFPVDPGDARVKIFRHGLATDWGSWEIVEATLRAFERVRTLWDPQLVTLISGQDYPLRRLDEWEEQALAAPSWIGESTPLRYRAYWGRRHGEGDDRWARYAFRWFRAPLAGRGPALPAAAFRARMRSAVALRLEPVVGVRRLARGRGRVYGIRRFRTPFGPDRPACIGSQWLALRRRELDALLDHDLAPGSPLRRLYRHTIIPDESALITPLTWRSPPSDLPRVSAYRWDPTADTMRTWTIDDLPALLASGSPFCRKIDPDRSAELMAALDEVIA